MKEVIIEKRKGETEKSFLNIKEKKRKQTTNNEFSEEMWGEAKGKRTISPIYPHRKRV